MSSTLFGPLTTVFTPPASCSNVITIADTETKFITSAWQGGNLAQGDWACFPPGFPTTLHDVIAYYSPGICPHGWTSVSRDTAGIETEALCCPRGYVTFFLHATSLWTGNLCYSLFPTMATVFSTNDPNFNGPVPTGAAVMTLTSINANQRDIPVYVNAISIKWQTTDTEIIRLLTSDTPSATDTSGASGSGTKIIYVTVVPEASGTANVSSGPTITALKSSYSNVSAETLPTSSIITPGSIAGIVVGSLGAIIFMLVGWAFVRIKRSRVDGNPHRGTGTFKSEKGWAKPELDGRDAYLELEGPQTVAEISADHRYETWEMGAESVPAELE